MFLRVMTLGLMLGSMAVTPAALADKHKSQYGYARSSVQAGPAYDYARVINVQPITRQVRVELPQRECWMEERYDEPPVQAGLAGPMILGGLIGGAIGSRFGDGDGRRAATVAGALIGSSIGHDMGERRRAAAAAAAAQPRVASVERCGVRYINNYEERVEGYDVEYEYCGRRYHTRTPYDPGESLRIRVDVSPVQDTYDRGYDDDREYDDDGEYVD
jgi:uncharacterized protein YcfJ